MKHIRTIIRKEWAEVFKRRLVVMVMLIVPLVFTILPLVMLGVMNNPDLSLSSSATPEMMAQSGGMPGDITQVCVNMSGGECMQVMMMVQFLLMFMMMPLLIPITIAAYSIVGEKTTRSLEPLLATPISTLELLLGKCLAAVIPAIGVTWVSFAIFNLGLIILKISPVVRGYILSPTWLLGILVLGPILAVIAVNFAIYISSRVTDPRAAEQISGVLIVPFMGVIFAQLAGIITINIQFMLIAIGVCALIAVGMMYLGTLIFDRENILTKWK
jgi:ABC-2 type transport system permease protein